MQNQKGTRNSKKGFIVLAFFLLVFLGFIVFKTWKILTIGVQVVTNNKIDLKKAEDRHVNLLILGVGGGNHEGPDLTDTIIFASIDEKTKKTNLVSLPRDLWVPAISAKINSAYIHGEENRDGSGLEASKRIVSQILGRQINYAIKIDFRGFVKAIDELGGLDVDVERTFDDYAYPITGSESDPCGHDDIQIASLSAQIASGSATELESFPCRYEHLHFDSGPTHMDGLLALKYVRSRHAIGPEGSDFSRSKRQSRIIQAIKDKVFSLGLLLNPPKALDVIDVIKNSFETDIKESEYDDFIRLAQKFKSSEIKSLVIDAGDSSEQRNGLLVNPPIDPEYGNQWVLIPALGSSNYRGIHEYLNCQIDNKNCPTPTLTPQKSL